MSAWLSFVVNIDRTILSHFYDVLPVPENTLDDDIDDAWAPEFITLDYL